MQTNISGFAVDLSPDLVFHTVFRSRRLLNSLFHGLDYNFCINRLFSRYRIGDLQEFQAISTYDCLYFCH